MGQLHKDLLYGDYMGKSSYEEFQYGIAIT